MNKEIREIAENIVGDEVSIKKRGSICSVEGGSGGSTIFQKIRDIFGSLPPARYAALSIPLIPAIVAVSTQDATAGNYSLEIGSECNSGGDLKVVGRIFSPRKNGIEWDQKEGTITGKLGLHGDNGNEGSVLIKYHEGDIVAGRGRVQYKLPDNLIFTLGYGADTTDHIIKTGLQCRHPLFAIGLEGIEKNEKTLDWRGYVSKTLRTGDDDFFLSIGKNSDKTIVLANGLFNDNSFSIANRTLHDPDGDKSYRLIFAINPVNGVCDGSDDDGYARLDDMYSKDVGINNPSRWEEPWLPQYGDIVAAIQHNRKNDDINTDINTLYNYNSSGNAIGCGLGIDNDFNVTEYMLEGGFKLYRVQLKWKVKIKHNDTDFKIQAIRGL